MLGLATFCGKLKKVQSSNSTDASFDALVSTTTEPTGDGVIDLVDLGGYQHNNAKFIPFGTDANNETFKMRISGWRPLEISGSTTLWVPTLLCEVTVTLSSTQAGVAGAGVVATEYFADTLTLTYPATDGISTQVVSPANDLPGHVVIDCKGCAKLRVDFDRNSSAASCNALYGTY